MDVQQIIHNLEQERARIDRAIAAITALQPFLPSRALPETVASAQPEHRPRVPKPKRHMSEETRAKLRRIGRRRWAGMSARKRNAHVRKMHAGRA